MDIKKLNEELAKLLESFIEEYDTDEIINGVRVQTNFNYVSACGVLVEDGDFGLAWDQYDNSIIYGTTPEDETEIKLPQRERLVPTKEDLEKAVSQINLPEGFPIDLFYEKVLKIGQEVNDNYDAYWEDWHAKRKQNEAEEPFILFDEPKNWGLKIILEKNEKGYRVISQLDGMKDAMSRRLPDAFKAIDQAVKHCVKEEESTDLLTDLLTAESHNAFQDNEYSKYFLTQLKKFGE